MVEMVEGQEPLYKAAKTIINHKISQHWWQY